MKMIMSNRVALISCVVVSSVARSSTISVVDMSHARKSIAMRGLVDMYHARKSIATRVVDDMYYARKSITMRGDVDM